MQQLTDRLADLRHECPTPSSDVLRDDLARGHRALGRRRRRAAGGVLALALVAGGTTYAASQLATRPTDPSAGPPSGQPTTSGTRPSDRPGGGASSPPAAPALRLTGYAGTQLPGFTVQTVPEGFVLQGANRFVLDIARTDDRTILENFEHKVVVMLRPPPAQGSGVPITVGGRPGKLKTDQVASTLYFTDDRGHQLALQAWGDLGLSRTQLITLAEGVTATREATLVEP